MSKVLIITTSLRAKSNSDILADNVCEKAVSGLNGWVDCFEKSEFKGTLFCGGINDMGEAAGKEEKLKKAYDFGKALA